MLGLSFVVILIVVRVYPIPLRTRPVMLVTMLPKYKKSQRK